MSISETASGPGPALQPGSFYLLHPHPVIGVAFSPDGQQLLSGSEDGRLRLWEAATGSLLRTYEGHLGTVLSVAFRSDGQRLLSGGEDGTVRLWEAATGHLLHTYKGLAAVNSVAFSPYGQRVLSGDANGSVQLWEAVFGRLLYTYNGHKDKVNSLAFSPDERQLLSGSNDGTLRLWEGESSILLRTCEGRIRGFSVAFSPNGQRLLSGGYDGKVLLWDADTSRLLCTCEGHQGAVRSVAFSRDGQRLLSGSDDTTVRVWDAETGRLLTLFEDHKATVRSVAFSPDGLLVLSVDVEGLFHIRSLTDTAATTRAAAEQQRSYVTANVLLMGDTGVGKSGLTERLVRGHFVPTQSTHGRRTEELLREDVTDAATGATLQRQILLWDLAGQPEYRVVHQLSLHNATLACVLFDSHRATDPFESPTYWGKALAQAHPNQPVPKVLVASRIDAGGWPASPDSIDAFRAEHAFEHFIATSASSGEGCADLAQLIQDTIPWDRLTVYTTNQRLETLREFVRSQVPPPVNRQQPGVYPLRLVTVEALHAAFGRTTDQAPTLADFSRNLWQIEHSGDVRLLAFRPTGDTPPPGNDLPQPTDYVLLDPTRHDAYASALLLAARNQPHGPGHLSETAIKADELRLPAEDRLADPADEKRLLWFVLDDLVRRDLALREEIEGAPYVVFPSQCITELTFPGTAAFGMAFGFAGPVRNIYATLIAQLAHYAGFRHERKPAFYRDAAVYHTPTGDCILCLRDTGKGHAELDARFDPSTPDAVRQGFIEFVERHLQYKSVSGSVTQRYAYHCRSCGYAFEDKIVLKRLAEKKKPPTLLCPACETSTPLRDLNTEPTPATQEVVEQMQQDAEEGRERMSAEVIIKAKEDQGIYDIFLSHNSKDKGAVEKIAHRLLEVGIRPWLDKWELAGGDTLQDALETTIKAIPCAALCFGPADVGKWHIMEIRAFLDRYTAGTARLVPVILPGIAQNETPELPLFVRQTLWVDMRKWEQPGSDAFYQLVCGIVGRRPGPHSKTDFDADEVNRWQKRR